MFSTTGSKAHSARKRQVSKVYSKSAIQASASLGAASTIIIHDRLLPLLDNLTTTTSATATAKPINILPFFYALTMDFVTARLFGISAGTNFTQDAAARDGFLGWYHCRRSHNFWPQELPRFTACMAKLGVRLVPAFVDEANAEIERFAMDMCDRAGALLGGRQRGRAGVSDATADDDDTAATAAATATDADAAAAVTVTDAAAAAAAATAIAPDELSPHFPTVYAQLATSMQKSERGKEKAKDKEMAGTDDASGTKDDKLRLELASEMLDHLAAGFETSAISLTYLTHELSQRAELQAALRDELRGLDPPVVTSSSSSPRALPSAKALDALPLLQAVLQETLRLHAAIPGPQPRVSPSGGGTIGEPGQFGEGLLALPPRTRVSAQAWSLHRNSDVFPEPDEWKPERWLDTRGRLLTADSDDGGGDRFREMMRWFWAFGSGGRMCVGNNLAVYQMKFIVAAIYTNYTTKAVDDEGMAQLDMYTAPPRSERLMFEFARV